MDRRTFDQIDYGRSHPQYDRRHDLSLTATYRFAPICGTCGRWILTTNFVYGTGQAYTPAARYTDRPCCRRPVDRLLAARHNSSRLLLSSLDLVSIRTNAYAQRGSIFADRQCLSTQRMVHPV